MSEKGWGFFLEKNKRECSFIRELRATENITEYEKQVPPNKFLVVSGNSGNCINLYNMWL